MSADSDNASIVGLDAFDTTAAASEGAVLEVRSPKTNEVLRWPDGRPWTIKFLGADSDKVSRVALQQSDRASQAYARTRQPRTTESLIKDQIERLVVATQEWDIPLGDGTPAKSEAKEYRSAYAKYKWLFEQANEFVDNRANFLKA